MATPPSASQLISIINHPAANGKAAVATATKQLNQYYPAISHLLTITWHPAQYGAAAVAKAQADLRTAVNGKPPVIGTPGDVAKQQAQRDATTILSDLFTQYGLGSLVPQIVKYIQAGYSADAVSVLLQQTPEYKQRFAANDQRVAKGLPALSPAEYIATERAYRQVMSAAGLPVGFYDQHSDFTNFLANDMSPTELSDRVNAATTALNQAPPETLNYFKQWYSTGDLIAYALDPTKAAPLVEKRIRAAEAAGTAASQGVGIGQTTAEQIGAQNVSQGQLQQGFGFIGQEQGNARKLSDIYGGGTETPDDLVKEVFFNDAQATQKRAKLASQERGSFSGSGAAGSNSLATETRT